LICLMMPAGTLSLIFTMDKIGLTDNHANTQLRGNRD